MPLISAKRQTQASRAQRQEIVIIPAHDARRAADRLDLHTLHSGFLRREKLSLHLAGNGQFVFQPLELALLVNQCRHGRGHGVERARQSAELIAPPDFYAMAEIAGFDVARGLIKVVYGARH